MTSTGTVLRHTMKKERPSPVARTAKRYNAAGHGQGTVELEPTVFGIEPNRAVLHQVVTAQLAATRAGTHSTRTRAEVRGGGAKPYRQKGTGRARQGSSRSPSMAGGGIALGPKPRDYEQRTPKKMVRLALLSALSDRAEIERIAVIDDWGIEEPDTRAAAVILRKLKLDGSVLVVLAQDEIEIALSFRNIPEASISTFAELSAHDVVRADWLLFSDRTVPTSVSDFSGTHEGRISGEEARAEARVKAESAESKVETEAEAEVVEAEAVEAEAVEAEEEVAEAEEEVAEEAPAKKAARTTKAAKAAPAKRAAKKAAPAAEEADAEAEAPAPAKRTRRTSKKAAAAAAAEAEETTEDDATTEESDDDA